MENDPSQDENMPNLMAASNKIEFSREYSFWKPKNIDQAT
jgi:hypothetical protein